MTANLENNDDSELQFAQQVAMQEYEEWLADPIAQAEYQIYLDNIKGCKSEIESTMPADR